MYMCVCECVCELRVCEYACECLCLCLCLRVCVSRHARVYVIVYILSVYVWCGFVRACPYEAVGGLCSECTMPGSTQVCAHTASTSRRDMSERVAYDAGYAGFNGLETQLWVTRPTDLEHLRGLSQAP